MAQQENPQNPGIFGTVMSYIPGFQNTEDHSKTSEQNQEESHKVQTAGDTGGVTADQATDISNQAFTNPGGQSGGSTGGSSTGTGQFGTHNTGSNQNQNTGVASGQGVGSGGWSSTAGGTGTNAGSGFDGSSGNAGQKNQVFYEDDDGAAGNTAQGTSNPSQKSNTTFDDDTGTHHSGYNPRGGSSQGSGGQTQTQAVDDGVRGAPIEGDGVKGYAMGAPVGSGDTERPNHPGDPSGQVSGAHLEYGPEETDTRDTQGRGTLGSSKGTGDSSFANVKTDDGKGNSSHVMTRTNESHTHHSSVTQM